MMVFDPILFLQIFIFNRGLTVPQVARTSITVIRLLLCLMFSTASIGRKKCTMLRTEHKFVKTKYQIVLASVFVIISKKCISF